MPILEHITQSDDYPTLKAVCEGRELPAYEAAAEFTAPVSYTHLVYPDQPYDQAEVVHPINGMPIVTPKNCGDFSRLLPKEERVLEPVSYTHLVALSYRRTNLFYVTRLH